MRKLYHFLGVFGVRIMLILLLGMQTIPALASEQGNVSVTASTPPKPNHFSLTLTGGPTDGTYSPDESATYQITFGSTRKYATEPLIVEAEWSPATVAPDGSRRDLLEYVLGSATAAYSGTPATVEPLNRKLRWTIGSFPAETNNQTVQFSLKGSPNLTDLTASGKITVRLLAANVTIPEATTPYAYRSLPPIAAKPPAAPAPITQPKLEAFTVDSVTASTAELSSQVSVPVTPVLSYGTNIEALAEKIEHTDLQKTHTYALTGLLPETQYYAKLVAIDAKGVQLTSDILTFETAAASAPPRIKPATLNFSSFGSPLFSAEEDGSEPTVVLPASGDFEFTIELDAEAGITTVQAIIDTRVAAADQSISLVPGQILNPERVDVTSPLPIQDDIQEGWAASILDHLIPQALAAGVGGIASRPGLYVTDLVQVKPGTFAGKLETPPIAGNFPVDLRIVDAKGNVVTQRLFTVKVVAKLTVTNAETKEPIENARLLFERFNPTTRLVEAIPTNTLGFANPIKTEPDGTVSVALPKGTYRVGAEAVGFTSQTVEFTIGKGEKDGFPQIALEPSGITPVGITTYYGNTLTDFARSTLVYLRSLAASNRLFDLIALLVLCSGVALSLLAFRARTHLPLRAFPWYLRTALESLIHRTSTRRFVEGRVTAADATPVTRAQVHLVDTKSRSIVAQTHTNRLGWFVLPITTDRQYQVLVTCPGFEPLTIDGLSSSALTSQPMALSLVQSKHLPPSILKQFTEGAESLLGISFEMVLVCSLILEALFIASFGWGKTWFFLTISLLNLINWIIYRQHEKRFVRQGN